MSLAVRGIVGAPEPSLGVVFAAPLAGPGGYPQRLHRRPAQALHSVGARHPRTATCCVPSGPATPTCCGPRVDIRVDEAYNPVTLFDSGTCPPGGWRRQEPDRRPARARSPTTGCRVSPRRGHRVTAGSAGVVADGDDVGRRGHGRGHHEGERWGAGGGDAAGRQRPGSGPARRGPPGRGHPARPWTSRSASPARRSRASPSSVAGRRPASTPTTR